MLNARAFASGATANGAFYVVTGFNGAYVTQTERFDGTTWANMAPIPTPHSQSRAAAVGNRVYVPGGFNSISFGGPLANMQIYDTMTDTWSQGMMLPAARSGIATAAFNGLVYAIGGYNPVGTGHTDVYIYDPVANSYTTGAPMPVGQGNMPGVVLNGEIYVVGGGTAPGAQFAYNPTANTWRTIAALPTSGGMCQAGGGFVQDNELWIVGCLGLPINQQVWIYNPGSNRGARGRSTTQTTKAARPLACSTHAATWPAAAPAELLRPLWNRPVHARLELPHQRLRQLRRQHSRRRQQRRQRSHRRRRQVRRLRLHLHQRLHHWRRSRCTRMVTKCTACKRWTYSGVG